MKIELTTDEKVHFEFRCQHAYLSFRYSLHPGSGNLTVTDRRIVFIPTWFFGTPLSIEIPLSEVTYIDNRTSNWFSFAPIYIRTTYEKCCNFDVPKEIGD